MSPSNAAAEDSALFRVLAESLPQMVWTCDGHGRCDYLSPQWEAYTGVPVASQITHGWLASLHPDDVATTVREWRRAVETGTPFEVDFRIRRHDGAFRWFKTRARPVVQADGTTRWFGNNLDIQDLRDAQDSAACATLALEERVRQRTDDLAAANARLAAIASRLRTTHRLAEIGSWELDVVTGVTTWSEELFRIYGMPVMPGAPAFETHYELFAPESWARLTEAMARAIAEGTSYSLELQAVRADGTAFTGLGLGKAVRDESGRVVRVVGAFQDTTERDLRERELRRVSERLQLATSVARLGVWDFDVTSGVLVWDAEMHGIYETTIHGFNGIADTWRRAVHPDDVARMDALTARAIAERSGFDTQFRIVVGEPLRVKHIRAAARIHVEPCGSLRAIGVNWDITAQVEAEEALREAEVLQREILANAGPAIIGTDHRGLLRIFSRGAEELLGYRAEEVIAQHRPALFHDPDELAVACREYERATGLAEVKPLELFVANARAGTPYVREWTMIRKDRSRVPVLMNVTELRNARGDAAGLLGIAVDLTQRKEHEQVLTRINRLLEERSVQAEAANRAKSAFVANVSHEIRTPLGAITGLAYLLSRTALNEEQRGLLRTLEQASKGLRSMVDDILDLSTIEAGQLALAQAPFDLPALVDEVRELMAGYAVGKALSLEVELDPATPRTVVGDRTRLLQVVSNLVGNATKFTERGAVRVSVRPTACYGVSGRLRFEVRDTGPGIAPEVMPRLFTRFLQTAEGRARRGAGTGLGLAIVKELVTLMGGDIGVESTLGVGTVFTFHLPLLAANEVPEPSPRSGRDAEVKLLPGVRALVVDDNEINREIARGVLALEGAKVATAAGGVEAIARLVGGERFDVVLMDIQMPDLDGIEVVQRLRALPQLAGLPVVALTAGALASERAQALAAGMNDYVTKPFDPAALVNVVARAVARVRGVAPRPVSAAAGSTPEPTAAWPQVDGIDGPDVQRRLGGDAELYREVLARMDVELADTPRWLTHEVGGELAMRLHRLIGAAGNVGARELAEAARAAKGAEPGDLGARLDRVVGEAARLRRGIAKVLGPAR